MVGSLFNEVPGDCLSFFEFAKSRALCAFAPYVPSCLLALHALCALLARLIYAPYAPFSSGLHALFVALKSF